MMTKQIFLPSDGPTGTPSLRTLGTGALQAAAGNAAPNGHGSSHDLTGTDPVRDLTRLSAGPGLHGYISWAGQLEASTQTAQPVAGVVYLTKIGTAHAYTINNIVLAILTAGTGVTPLANCSVGIYDSGGTRRFLSADQSSSWATNLEKTIAVSGGYTVTANDFVYIAVLVGTQSTTALRFNGFSNSAPTYLGTSASAYQFASQLTGQTSLPSTLTLSSNANSAVPIWAAVK